MDSLDRHATVQFNSVSDKPVFSPYERKYHELVGSTL